MIEKSLDQLTSEELYALAQEKELQETEKQREEIRSRIEQLRTQKRELIAEHKKEITQIDAEINKLGGKTRGKGKPSGQNLTDTVFSLVEKAGTISTQEIKSELEKQGIRASNLSQTLAYLKRQGRVTSSARATYTVA